MKANLKKTLPQEGTGYSLAGESLGGPSGSSCPTYSGGGQDRYRYRAPRNTESKKLTETYCLSLQKSQGLKLTFNKDREVDDMVLALHANRQRMGNMEDQTSSALQEHMLEAVMIVEKVASFAVGPQDQRTLNDAALTIKKALMDIMNIEAKKIETRLQLLELRRELIEKKAIVRGRLESTSDGDGLRDQPHSAATSEGTGQKAELEKEHIESSPSTAVDLKTNFSRSCDASVVNNSIAVEQQEDETNDRLTYRTEEPQLSADQELGEMVQALSINKFEIGNMENHAAIKKKVAKEIREKPENTVIDIKDTLDELQKLSDSTKKKQRRVKKTTLLNMSKGLPELTTQTESLAHISIDDQLDSNKMTGLLEKYLQNTIQESESRKEKSLQNRDAKTNDNLASKKTHKCDKRSNKLRTPSPAPEPVYNIWYVEDRFKKLALKRVERNEEINAAQSRSSKPDDDTEADANINRSRDAVNPRVKSLWWSTELAEHRRAYLAARRQYSRSRRRKLRDEAAEEQLYIACRTVKNTYRTAICKAKAKAKPKASESS